MPVGSDWPPEFSTIANAGYYVALRIGFAFPVEENNEFPEKWVSYYTSNGLMLRDPVVRWAYANTGSVRWSELVPLGTSEVLIDAEKFGLRYGAVVVCTPDKVKNERSYGSFARLDREITDSEIAVLSLQMKKLHVQSLPPSNLTEAELEALRLVKNGLRLKEIAYQLGVSEGAIKQRLNGAKRKLSARTNTQAASRAVEFRIL